MNNLSIGLIIIFCMFIGAYAYYQMGEISIPEIIKEDKEEVKPVLAHKAPTWTTKREPMFEVILKYGIVENEEEEKDFYDIEHRMLTYLDRGRRATNVDYLNKNIQLIQEERAAGYEKYGVSWFGKLSITHKVKNDYDTEFEMKFLYSEIGREYPHHIYYIDEYADSAIDMLRDYGSAREWETI